MRSSCIFRLVLTFTVAAAGVAAAAAPASADEALATVAAPTPVVAEGATVGWLTAPTATSGASKGSRVLAYRVDTRPVVTTTVVAGGDLDAGRDARGRSTFTWSTCTARAARCAVMAFRPGQKRATVLARVAHRGQALFPSLAGSRLVTARRVPVPGVEQCSVPFVTQLGSSAPPRRLQVGACGRIAALDANISRVAMRLVDVPPSSGNSEEQARIAPLDGGRAVLADVQTAGEAPNEIGGVGLRGSVVTLSLPGGPGRTSGFKRISYRTGDALRLPAFEPLAGGAAPVGSGIAFLSARIAPDFGADVTCTDVVPCTIVAGADPARPRTLVRRLTLDPFDDPRTVITGRLTTRRVDAKAVRATTGVSGVPIELLSTDGSDFHTRQDPDVATPTALRGVTDATGRFATALPAHAYQSDYIARTADQRVAATAYQPTG